MIDKIQTLLADEYTISLKGLPLTTKLSELQEQDSSFDSLNRIDFLIQVENAFGIEFPAELKIVTLEQLINEIEIRIAK